jgi:TfoX/Sxy family transcriptional regulator of competence genes
MHSIWPGISDGTGSRCSVIHAADLSRSSTPFAGLTPLYFSAVPYRAAFDRELPNYNLRSRMRGIEIPTLLIVGSEIAIGRIWNGWPRSFPRHHFKSSNEWDTFHSSKPRKNFWTQYRDSYRVKERRCTVAADEHLVSRVRTALSAHLDTEEKRMFGGITFMVRGKMCVSVGRDRIMCRVDPDLHDSLVQREGCRTVVMKGRQYRGFVYVDAGALKTQRELKEWIALALEHNSRTKTSARKRRS